MINDFLNKTPLNIIHSISSLKTTSQNIKDFDAIEKIIGKQLFS